LRQKIFWGSMLFLGVVIFFLTWSPRNNRAYLEKRIGTEVSRVYPTQNLEDLFEQFPNGFNMLILFVVIEEGKLCGKE